MKKSLKLYQSSTPKASNSIFSTNFQKSGYNYESGRKSDININENDKSLVINKYDHKFIKEMKTNDFMKDKTNDVKI